MATQISTCAIFWKRIANHAAHKVHAIRINHPSTPQYFTADTLKIHVTKHVSSTVDEYAKVDGRASANTERGGRVVDSQGGQQDPEGLLSRGMIHWTIRRMTWKDTYGVYRLDLLTCRNQQTGCVERRHTAVNSASPGSACRRLLWRKLHLGYNVLSLS